ncbi:hypothetical protein A3J32_03125 [Candidatus Saccharibacteria bacterium RIFCSPLOWO2_02_FULL_46_7]|nr:MAG: hypothetical protein A3J32_03125 [Candidatus Saccharibacteria bacterium RIFCSPLOWO2_02_FULL_46_7]
MTSEEWWRSAYTKRYFETRPSARISAEQTAKDTAFIVKSLNLKKGAKLLDLGCGHGRHTIALAEHGYAVTGLDYSPDFIEIARKEAKAKVVSAQFVQQDMREITYETEFDAVINFFSSFGYFKNDEDNQLVLRKISKALKPGGILLIDLNSLGRTLRRYIVNGRYDEKRQVFTLTRDRLFPTGQKGHLQLDFDPKTMKSSWTYYRSENGKTQQDGGEIRVYSLAEIIHLLKEVGLEFDEAWGSYELEEFTSISPRMILKAHKIE